VFTCSVAVLLLQRQASTSPPHYWARPEYLRLPKSASLEGASEPPSLRADSTSRQAVHAARLAAFLANTSSARLQGRGRW
jgi:hypothetical protein